MRLFIMSVSVLLLLDFSCTSSKVVDSFSKCSDFFLRRTPPVIPGILKGLTTQNERFKIICQHYKNENRFATLYDTTNKTPIFSAYKYTRQQTFEEPKLPWMIESQLEPSTYEISVPFAKQTSIGDYSDNQNVMPGPLFPYHHAADKVTAESTYTLTNSVPQKKNLRNGSWTRCLIHAKDEMNMNCRDQNNKILAHVLVGALPGKDTLQNRVNIPSHVWMAFCCYSSVQSSWISMSYHAINKVDVDNECSGKPLQFVQDFIKKEWKIEVTLFLNDCGVR